MKKYKALIGKHYQLLSLTETTDNMPDGKDIYYDLGSDMKIPDFVLIHADNAAEAREKGLSFIESWRQKNEAGTS